MTLPGRREGTGGGPHRLAFGGGAEVTRAELMPPPPLGSISACLSQKL